MSRQIVTRRGTLKGPLFLPDATRGIIKSLAPHHMAMTGVQAVMTNAFHLSLRPGADLIRSVGGLHRFMGWERPIMTDSGGYQIFSLVRENPNSGTLTKRGFVYRDEARGKIMFTPQKSISSQLRLGSDITFCLDVCTHPEDPLEKQKESVDLTIAWARLCKKEFDRRYPSDLPATERPLLFAVIQGGESRDLRQRCVDALLEIGFDGFGFGGWPVAETGKLVDMVGHVAELLPNEFPLHALGVGRPENIVAAWQAGYTSFDSTLPTRDARRGRVFVSSEKLEQGEFDPAKPAHYIYLRDKKHKRDNEPIDPACPCPTCQNYPLAYLHHLFAIDDGAALALATIHNLTYFERLMKGLSARFPVAE